MIATDDDIARAMHELKRADPRLASVHATAGAVPLRRSAGGLEGLTGTIIAQQVSRASADAIFARFAAAVDITDPAAILAASDEAFRAAGLSRPKQKTMLAIAAALLDGRLDFARIAAAPAPDAIAELTAIHGVGTWTAECYLLFSLGHPDVFPAGDLALQAAVAHGLCLDGRPDEKSLKSIAAFWSPHRSVAARLFWSYYHAVTKRDAAPVEPESAAAQKAVGGPRSRGGRQA